jgi:TusA-related sulfurtransferase
MKDAKVPTHYLDITQEVCPFTFVRTKLLLERVQGGEVVAVRLKNGEPLTNVPRSAAELGHRILKQAPEDPARPDGVHVLWIEKA